MRNLQQPYTFLGEPNIRLRPAEYDGWHIQTRQSANSDWEDVPNGYYKRIQAAVEAIKRMFE